VIEREKKPLSKAREATSPAPGKETRARFMPPILYYPVSQIASILREVADRAGLTRLSGHLR
jgi:hypothetical protein